MYFSFKKYIRSMYNISSTFLGRKSRGNTGELDSGGNVCVSKRLYLNGKPEALLPAFSWSKARRNRRFIFTAVTPTNYSRNFNLRRVAINAVLRFGDG